MIDKAPQGMIFEVLPKLAAEIGAIGKANVMDTGRTRFNYRSVDQLLNHLGPLFAKHGVTPSVKCFDHQTERREVEKGYRNETFTQLIVHTIVGVTVRLSAPDGSYVENTCYGEGMDYNGDKSTNKAMAAGFKYALFLGLCIPVEDVAIEDSDRYSPEATSGLKEPPAEAKQAKRSQSKKRQPAEANGAEMSKYAEALKIIESDPAPTLAKLTKYQTRVDELAQSGEVSAEQHKWLCDAIERKNQARKEAEAAA